MPPRGRPRLSASVASTPSKTNQTSAAATPADTSNTTDEAFSKMLLDPWTDVQEIALFKAIIRWKPAGIHKHVRMIAIAQYIRQHTQVGPEDDHLRIPGIWRKLSSLYNLAAIDERENSIFEPDEETDDPTKEPFHPFSLPEDDFGDAMWDARLAPAGSSSSPALLEMQELSSTKTRGRSGRSGSGTGRASTVEDTEEEARSSPLPTRARRVGRPSKLVQVTPQAQGRLGPKSRGRGRGRPAKASATVEDEEVGTAEEGEDGDDEEDEGEEEGRDESMAGDSPSVVSTRTASNTSRGGRGQSRGRRGRDTRRSTRRR
ncbi:MAG: hypothetical protein M1817_003309 [Caeruleum heppii]|nr:MAG: hypothetical protein M1817_003309 [Caeruleum heppii]